jgi:hypothetical protein
MANDNKAQEIWKSVSDYLIENTWYRDGDDPAIWRFPHGESVSFGTALTIQLIADGLKWPYV